MKNNEFPTAFFIFLSLVLVAIFAVWGFPETVDYQPGTSGTSTMNSEVRYCYAYETDGDVNDFTTDEFTIGNAVIDRIVVEANGVDETFKLYLYDCAGDYNDVTLWSKTNLSTAAMPVSEAVVMSDAGSTEFCGVPVTGNLKITLADGDDATLDALQMFIYYRRQ